MKYLLEDRRRMIAASEEFGLTNQVVDDWLYDDDEDANFHEAGHAVAATILDIEFYRVTIQHQDERGSNGRIEFHRRDAHYDWIRGYEKADIAMALNGCIVLMAGMAAQLRRQGDGADLQSSGASDRDKLDFVSGLTAEAIGMVDDGRKPPEAKDIQQWAWREACLLIANPRVWRAVSALAWHLAQHEAATESEVAEIVAAEKVRYRPRRFRPQAALSNQARQYFSTQE